MSKFEKRPGAGRDRPSRPSGTRRDKPRFAGNKEESSKKNDYKAKRSFTKNKGFRETKEGSDTERKPYRPFDKSGPGAYKNKFKKDGDKAFGDRPKRSFSDKGDDKKSFNKDREKSFGDKPYSDRPKRSFSDKSDDKKSFSKDREKSFGDKPYGDHPKRNFSDRDDSKKSFGKDKPFGDKPRKPFGKTPESEGGKKPRFNKREALAGKRGGEEEVFNDKRVKFDDFEEGKVFSGGIKKGKYENKKYAPKGPAPLKKQGSDDGLVRLNKYLSNAGIASRREADILIQGGTVKVNGVVVDQLGYKIKPGDKVTYGDAAVKSERKVYLLLNKPKDYITTVDDPQERKTVMELINGACKERVYPVGRLDRNTTGLLLFTNDGEMTTRLTHPKFGVKKIYHVSLNKGLKPDDFKAIIEGVELEDGMVKADDLAFVGEGKKEVGIEIHSGRNRVVRRLFEHLGYDVLKLDRVAFAGLTKKDLPRGKHRFLTAKEISYLHMVG
ncbi:MAG: rRNA pseudouridine synthase [Bacteroidia bacterium]|nr:rRNA pseudouridine synthase [Bacteroidia bacterium]